MRKFDGRVLYPTAKAVGFTTQFISEDGCDTDISLNVNGKCESYEKGFNYYFNLVWNALENKNYMTKQQKEFLYDYFTDIGDRFKAEMFLED